MTLTNEEFLSFDSGVSREWLLTNGIGGFASSTVINSNSRRFNKEINWLLKKNVPLDEWIMRLGVHMDIENAIDVFNRQCLHYQ